MPPRPSCSQGTLRIPSPPHLAYYMAISSCVSLPLCYQYLIPQYEKTVKWISTWTPRWYCHPSLTSPAHSCKLHELSLLGSLLRCATAQFPLYKGALNISCLKGLERIQCKGLSLPPIDEALNKNEWSVTDMRIASLFLRRWVVLLGVVE